MTRPARNSRLALPPILLAFILCGAATAAPRYKILQNFRGPNGDRDWGGVILDGRGNVFGATPFGGGSGCYGYGCGLVFELAPRPGGRWQFAALYKFGSGENGATPYGRPTLDAAGNIYGTTQQDGLYHDGTAFELTPGPGGWTETTLFNFCPKMGESGCEDGGGTQAGLLRDTKGNLYGTKQGGGGYPGNVFALTPGADGWTETMLTNSPATTATAPLPMPD